MPSSSYVESCLARIRNNGRNFNHHCSFGIRWLKQAANNLNYSDNIITTYSKLVSSFNACMDVHLYCLLTIPKRQTVFWSVQQTLPSSSVLFFNWHTSQSTALAAILVPRFLSKGVGEPPCCICPERENKLWVQFTSL